MFWTPILRLGDVALVVKVVELTDGFSQVSVSLKLFLQPATFLTQSVRAVASIGFVFPSLSEIIDVSIACCKDIIIGAFLWSTWRVSTRCEFVCDKVILFARAKEWHDEDLLCVKECLIS